MKKSLIALAFGTLALGMAEFVMMGILPDVARDLGVSIPRAGDLISAYAIGVCVGAPATVLIARKRALKGILLALAALIVLGNVCASLAPDFWMLLAFYSISREKSSPNPRFHREWSAGSSFGGRGASDSSN